MTQIGITERGDAALNLEWYNWVLAWQINKNF